MDGGRLAPVRCLLAGVPQPGRRGSVVLVMAVLVLLLSPRSLFNHPPPASSPAPLALSLSRARALSLSLQQSVFTAATLNPCLPSPLSVAEIEILAAPLRHRRHRRTEAGRDARARSGLRTRGVSLVFGCKWRFSTRDHATSLSRMERINVL